ncbi:MAG: type II toxin-antitoxin system RelE/ParE family toxin [Bacteroidetes bacterium]|nr:type II toxin-antitoxin system RelE/ParE family toxin [Bacteroidota bacterium]
MKKDIKQKEWNIKLYKDKNGKCPIKDFMKTLSKDEKEWMTICIELLKNEGFKLRRPQCDYLGDDIYELRIKLSGDNTRTLYFFCYENYIVLTHTFIKKTEKVPENEIKKAIKYKNDFLNRYKIDNIKGA